MNTNYPGSSCRVLSGIAVLAGAALGSLGCSATDDVARASDSERIEGAQAALQPSAPQVNCANLTVTGSTTSESGASWTYTSVDGGVSFRLSGVVMAPPGNGPFPGVVVNHGTGGSPRGGGPAFEFTRAMRASGAVAIGTFYTHARVDRVNGAAQGAQHLPSCSPPCSTSERSCQERCFGASPTNVARARKTRDILSCLQSRIGKAVDLTRVASHGHSRGAFLTGEVVGSYPNDYRAASHTAGGVAPATANPDRTTLTNYSIAQQIIVPYSIHHSPDDDVVALGDDQRLRDILLSNGVAHELHSDYFYGAPNDSDEGPGVDNDHPGTAIDPVMLSRVRSWYQLYGVLSAP